MTRRSTALASVLLGLSSLSGCDDPQKGWEAAGIDHDFNEVYPILIRDCGFHTCHGSEERMFRVYGPGRARLSNDLRAYEAVTGDELSLSFSIALSMIDTEHPERSLILTKPLALEAGGAAHGGIDDFGRKRLPHDANEGYLAIKRFVMGNRGD